jgi:alcohol dehydrogenase class IV
MAIISYLTQVHFDVGAVASLAADTAALGIRRPMLVTDQGIAKAGLLDGLDRSLTKCVFDATPPNPTEDAVGLATDMYRAQGCDGLVAFGGGSPMDLAKAVALMATHGGKLGDYTAATGGTTRIKASAAPVVAVPTTAGTGSEVGRATVIVMSDGKKRAIVSPHLIPRLAVCDPDLLRGVPPALAAGTGMDAIAHCVETLLSPLVNPPAEAIALDGLSRGMRFIERACAGGDDAEARWQMMMASLEGGLAFQKGLGAVHAMSHALGALRGAALHHGTLNAVLLPVVLRFNSGHATDKYARMVQALSLPTDCDLAEVFGDLNSRLGLPVTLQDMGVVEDVLPAVAAAAAEDFSARTNPRPATEADYLAMLRQAF